MLAQSKRQRFLRLFISYAILIFVIVAIIYTLLWTIGDSVNTGDILVSTTDRKGVV